MSQALPEASLPLAAAPGLAEPAFTISGPARAGVAAAMLPNGFAPHGAPPVFTITGPGNDARMRALEQRCEELQRQISGLVTR